MTRLLSILPLLLCWSLAAAQDSGTIETVAGGGTEIGDNVPATELRLLRALDIDVDIDGNIFVADTDNQVVRRIDAVTGIATIVAGIPGEQGFDGDGGPATQALLNRPGAVSVTDAGLVYIGDTGNRRLRRVDPATGVITTIAGTGVRGRFPDNVNVIPTSQLEFGEIVSVLAGSNIVFVGDGIDADGNGNNQIIQIDLQSDSAGVAAGTGRPDFAGEGGSPLNAGLTVEGLAFDFSGQFGLLFADPNAHRVRSIAATSDSTSAITTVAGRGPAGIFGEGGFFGDGEPATEAQLNFPSGVAISPGGTIYIADVVNSRVRAVDLDGTLITVAGSGEFATNGDGGLAVRAAMRQPTRVALDFDDNLLVLDSDRDLSVIRRVFDPTFRFPLLESNRTALNFPPASLGVGAQIDILFANAGNADLQLTTFTFDNPLFSLVGNLPITVGPNLQRSVSIRFEPLNEDQVTGTLTILTNDLFQKQIELPLSGSGIVPDIDVLPRTVEFDPTFTDEERSQRIRISNLTQGQLFVEEVVVSDTLNFSTTQLASNTIGAGQSQDIDVRFHPTVAGPLTAELVIRSNDPDEPEFVVPLSGVGIVPKPGGFLDVAASAGVADPGASFGIAWADYDTDGDPDLYLVKSFQPNRLYRNEGGTFTDVAPALGVADDGDGSGAAWADYDGDGDLDLYVTNFGQPNRLYRNDGATFTEVGAAAGVDDTGDGFGSAWADTDRDGDPDLYVANFGPNVFFRNRGDGTFEEVADQLGIADSSSGIQPVFADFDNDQDPDLFVANSGPNRFWRNNGDGTFTDASLAFVPQDNGASTGAAVGDFDRDGFLDLYVTYFGANRLYRNLAGEGFADVGIDRGVADTGNGRGAVWGDFDNDGWLDLFTTNRDTKNRIYRNTNGGDDFVEVGELFGVDTRADSRGVALADFDGDGGLDMFVAIQGDPDQLFRNQEAEGNWLVVKPLGTVSSYDAIGARIELIYNQFDRSIREITGGTSFLSQDALCAAFGIGEAADVDTLSIRWPSGFLQRFSREEIGGINRVFTVVEEEPLPPVDVRITTTGDILVANGTAFTDINLELLDAAGELTLVSNRSVSFSLDIGGGRLETSGPVVADGRAAARFTAGTLAGTVSMTIIVAGLPTQRLLIELLPPLAGADVVAERIAGTGGIGFSGDGGPATEADLNAPREVIADTLGNVYVADSGNNRIRLVSVVDSTIQTIAGSGASGLPGPIEESPAINADIGDPRGLAFDLDGTLLITEFGGQRVRRVDLGTGLTTGFAGTGFAGFSGDGELAIDANMTQPRGIDVDSLGTVYFATFANNAVRRVVDGIITTVAGDPLQFFGFRDNVPATESRVDGPSAVAVDADGNLYVAETFAHRVRRVSPDGIITTFIGDGTAGDEGDGGPARFARVNGPQDIFYDPAGRLYIVDSGNNRILSVDLETGLLQTVAGNTASGTVGSSLSQPGGVAVAPDGTVLVADALNDRILRLTIQYQDADPPVDPGPVDPGGGGDGSPDFNGDGIVDFQDFLPFAEAFGSSNPAFDLTDDGAVGFADFLIFANAFGRPTSSNPALTARGAGRR